MHQVSVGIQRELRWSMAVEARYVGTFGRGIWRGIDNNQIQLSQPFMDDFLRARSNGFLAQQAGLAFSPVFNPNVPGSQPLSVLPTFAGVLLTNATVIQSLQQNEPGRLANTYMLGTGAAGRAQRSRGVPAEPRHLLVQRHSQRRVQRLQRAAARAPAPVP